MRAAIALRAGASARWPAWSALCVLLWVLTPHFLTVSNLLNVLEQTSINAVIAVGHDVRDPLRRASTSRWARCVALAGVVLARALQCRLAGAASPSSRRWPSAPRSAC